MTLPVAEVPRALEALAGEAEPELARTLRAIRDAWPEVAPPRIVSAGLSNVLKEPEARDPAFVRLVVERVERPATYEPLGDGLRLDWDQGLAAVATRWSDGLDGTLTLVGPARLRYGRALQVVGGVARALRDGPTAA